MMSSDLCKLNKKERDFYVYNYLSGNSNRKLRQVIMEELLMEKIPIAKCGIHNLITELDKNEEA